MYTGVCMAILLLFFLQVIYQEFTGVNSCDVMYLFAMLLISILEVNGEL